MGKTPKLILIRGVPGSGKSTYALKLKKKNTLHYEADMFHIDKKGVYRFKTERLQDAHAWCLDMATVGIEEGHDVIVSNTFITNKALMPYIWMAQDYKAKVKVIHVVGHFKSIHDVPKDIMDKMIASWEPYEGEEVYINEKE